MFYMIYEASIQRSIGQIWEFQDCVVLKKVYTFID